ncbi:MAG: hypothetical protein FWD40_01810 [Treponema sp.]|nr:hypothetical protein [Treponema sp.]
MYSENDKPQKTNIFRTYLDFVDSTRFFTTPFSWLYLIVALAFLALPVMILASGIRWEIFDLGGTYTLGFILVLAASVAAAIIAFIVAWNGRKKVSTDKITIGLIIDSVADLLAVSIKAQAHFIGVFGFFGGLFALLFGGEILSLLGIDYAGVPLMIGALLLGYGMVWFSRLFKFLFAKIAKILVKVIVQIFKFVVLHAIPVIYNFIAHIVRQLFDYIFIFIQAHVDYLVNSLKVLIALVARLGRFLLAYARSPFKNKDYNDAKITYNE